MTTAEFIDLVLTPIGGGVGTTLGVSWAMKREPEKFEKISSLRVRVLMGAAVAFGLFALKVF